MTDLARLSLSIDKPLLTRFQKILKRAGYANRSEFIRDMIRQKLVDLEWEKDRVTLGTVTLVYTHHQRSLSGTLTDLQHRFHDEILASTHVHLDHDICAEVIIVKARAARIRDLADLLGQQKGVLHAALSFSSTGKELA